MRSGVRYPPITVLRHETYVDHVRLVPFTLKPPVSFVNIRLSVILMSNIDFLNNLDERPDDWPNPGSPAFLR